MAIPEVLIPASRRKGLVCWAAGTMLDKVATDCERIEFCGLAQTLLTECEGQEHFRQQRIADARLKSLIEIVRHRRGDFDGCTIGMDPQWVDRD